VWRGHSCPRTLSTRTNFQNKESQADIDVSKVAGSRGQEYPRHTPQTTRQSKAAWLEPEPLIILSFLYQASSDGILPNVFDGFLQALVASEDVVERFVLPHRSQSSVELIDAAGGCAFDGSHDFGKGESPAFRVSKGGKKQVCVIGHDYSGVEMDRLAMVVEAMLQG
jgi:hypothetical protein